MPEQVIRGDEAMAYGALVAGARLAASYPGSPATGTVETLIGLALPPARPGAGPRALAVRPRTTQRGREASRPARGHGGGGPLGGRSAVPRDPRAWDAGHRGGGVRLPQAARRPGRGRSPRAAAAQ